MIIGLIKHWPTAERVPPQSYQCGHCGKMVGPDIGFNYDLRVGGRITGIYICSYCLRPSYFEDHCQIPGVAAGSLVLHLPKDIEGIYEEARNAIAANCFTAAVLICRKILMHLAVEKGAKAGENFKTYVEYLDSQHYIPPDGKHWVDHIRDKGNEANHEIVQMSRDDAELLLTFVEMLLRFIYEFPNKIPKPKIGPAGPK